MQELSLHILDIAQNSITAQATLIEIRIDENAADNVLDITIQDNGKGMDAEKVKKVLDPFFTTRTTRKVGLGIPLYREAALSHRRRLFNSERGGRWDDGICAVRVFAH